MLKSESHHAGRAGPPRFNARGPIRFSATGPQLDAAKSERTAGLLRLGKGPCGGLGRSGGWSSEHSMRAF